MNDRTPTVWQIASGESGRYYTYLFLEHDLMCMGPGDLGHYIKNKEKYDDTVVDKELGRGKRDQIRSFCQSVQPGDIVLLRRGKKLVSVGLVGESDCEYFWNPNLDDVYGWDLQHCRRVIWQEHLKKEIDHAQQKEYLFEHSRRSTFSGVGNRSIPDWLQRLFSTVKERDLKKEVPEITPCLELDEVKRNLFNSGLSFDKATKVTSVFEHLKRLGEWYWISWSQSGRPSEHEVVAHMVLPFLYALGWSEQQLAVEWNDVDLAAFLDTPTEKDEKYADKCMMVCEAKPLWSGLQDALQQAISYVQNNKLVGCKKILITDGLRFDLYEREGKTWKESPDGHLNVRKIRTDHIAPAGTNAIETIMALTPEGVQRPIRS